MLTAADFLTTARYKLIRIVALTIFGCCSVLIIPTIAFFLWTANTNLLIYLVMLGCSIAGGGATLFLLRQQRLEYAALPLGLTIVVLEIAVAVFFPDVATFAIPFLAVVVLLVGVGSQPRVTLIIGVICTILGMVLAALTPLPMPVSYGFSLGPALLPVRVMALGTLIVLIWLVTNRLLASQNAAIAFASQRLAEAEAARQETERAHHLLEQHSIEQERLLALVTSLETPIMQFADHVFVVPLIGNVDSRRAAALTNHILETVHTARAELIILDIAGVPVVDTTVARILMQTAQAIQLMGARVSISGMNAQAALALAHLGVVLDDLMTTQSPQEAIQHHVTQRHLASGPNRAASAASSLSY
jgi:anti-anti-sigma regulatory factor